MTFRERYLAGEADFEEIYDLTDEWGFSDVTCTLREYLGLTAQEEDLWISESDEALESLLQREKNRRIFFTDLDGTLLTDQKEITPKTRETIHRALDQGHFIVLSTGRTLYSTLNQARRLDLMHPGCYLISYNGGQIYDIGEKALLFSCAIPRELVRYCFDEAKKFGIHIQTYAEDYVVAETDSPQIAGYCALQKLPVKIVKRLEDILAEDPPKMLVIEDDSEKLDAFRQKLEKPLAGKVDLFLSQSNYLELVPTGVSKGNAVRFLCNYLNVPIRRSVAAGDMENDLTMIDAAGIGAVMCNGSERVKAKADYVTENDNNHDGAAEIIQKFILGER